MDGAKMGFPAWEVEEKEPLTQAQIKVAEWWEERAFRSERHADQATTRHVRDMLIGQARACRARAEAIRSRRLSGAAARRLWEDY